mgnify:CR=1 FL=1
MPLYRDGRLLKVKIGVQPELTPLKLRSNCLVHVDHLKEAGINVFLEISQDRLDADGRVSVGEVDEADLVGAACHTVHDAGGVRQ